MRDPTKLPHKDISIRTFDIAARKIILQFHYGDDEISPTIREYNCPPKPDYGCEIIYIDSENVVDEVSCFFFFHFHNFLVVI